MVYPFRKNHSGTTENYRIFVVNPRSITLGTIDHNPLSGSFTLGRWHRSLALALFIACTNVSLQKLDDDTIQDRTPPTTKIWRGQ
jgi:hypothetical protein